MMPSDKPLLSVQNLRKSFSGIKAVSDLSFTVSRGEIVGLIGPNGSGKSTSIDCVTGFTKSDRGTTTLDGVELSHARPEQIAQAGLARTFQNVRVYDRLTVTENVLIARQAYDGVSWWKVLLGSLASRAAERRAEDRGRELIHLVGLGAMSTFPAAFLSYGQKKLLALAMALMSDPKIVILDEPLAGVNPTVIRRVAGLIETLNRNGQTFIIVEHNVQFIMDHCSRVVVMEQGRKLAEGQPSLIKEDERVLQAYLGKADAVAMELAFHGR
ncbi:ABC transporter ATP-binding protein [Mesorhizobium sp. M3A.F.Ca.ET.174.01.1.1]|uniref:ABC transporter ATP-binding protein n=1 Tax=unclassified Mesorhizobium TaxID=325217 RepID=UPI001093BA32|nr:MULTISPECIES: ABC transporter ATP-binding protein [unclassified Mesorhizobium]TGS87420.1 ABC transporter ATP-binding protein [Mesorhizobium sp. M3A.F.Ca.ET.175.01.1.1]TGT27880.1 ABC transporter ATP-binding protein [Mesorhizobium sp. M3A.F.Ca.ET.174.01.1.1]